jgi:hypothetical protein
MTGTRLIAGGTPFRAAMELCRPPTIQATPSTTIPKPNHL